MRHDRWFVINPHNFETIVVPDSDNPGFYYPEIPEKMNNSMVLTFFTNKNDYLINDLKWVWTEQTGCGGLIWNELQVGRVTLPDSLPTIYYTTQSPTSDGPTCFRSGCLVSNTMPPLTLQECSYNAESEVPIKVAIGGRIFIPLEAEIGMYTVNFETSDSQVHEETVYVYENTQEASFKVIPIFELDDEDRIDSVSLRFEDNEGNVFEDPPILWGKWWITASSDFRGEGYYHIEDTYLYGYDYGICFQSDISILSPTDLSHPTSNDHKIYYEDVLEMCFVFEGGDSVQRLFRFNLKDLAYYPDIRAERDGQYLTFFPYWGNPPGEEVVSIKYQWGDATWSPMGEWIEVAGPSATVEIPLGATLVRYTAKGTAGFYYLGTAVQWRPLEIF